MTDRITNLEEKHAFLARQVEQLDGVIRELYAALEALQREVRAARSHIDRVEARLAAPPEPPAT